MKVILQFCLNNVSVRTMSIYGSIVCEEIRITRFRVERQVIYKYEEKHRSNTSLGRTLKIKIAKRMEIICLTFIKVPIYLHKMSGLAQVLYPESDLWRESA